MILVREFRVSDLEGVIHLVEANVQEKYKNEFYMTFHSSWPDGMVVVEEKGGIVGFILAISDIILKQFTLFQVKKPISVRGIALGQGNVISAVGR